MSMLGNARNKQNQWQQIAYGQGSPPAGREAGFLQQHPGAQNIPMYQEPDIRQYIAQNYQQGQPLTQEFNPMQALFGNLGFGDMPFLEQLLKIRGEGETKKKKKKKPQGSK